MNKQVRSHRGFILGHGEKAGYMDLPLVDALYKRIETTHDFGNDPVFLHEVVMAAKQVLFNRDRKFIVLEQVRSPAPYWVKHFCLSTLRYLNGEPRELALENYRDLMSFHPTDVVEMDHGVLIREHKLEYAYCTPDYALIAGWLAQEDGLTDLVMSLQLIAGSLPSGWHDHSQAA